MSPRKVERALLLGALVGGLSTAAALVVERTDALGFKSLELGFYDRALRTFSPRPEKSKDVVLVLVDDRTFQEIRANESMALNYGNWPYYRAFWADLAGHLVEEGARAVAVDMVFDEAATDASGDTRLGDAISSLGLPFYAGFAVSPSAPALPKLEAKNVLPQARRAVAIEAVIAEGAGIDESELGEAAYPMATPEEQARALAFPVESRRVEIAKLRGQPDREGKLRQSSPIPPIAPLLRAAPGFGLVLEEEDRDGVMRRTRFAYTDGANTYVTLPVAVAADLFGASALELSPGRLRLGARELEVNRDGTALIHYGGQLADRFELVPAYDVINDAALARDKRPRVLPEGLFRGKVVVVGGAAIGTADVKATPFNSYVPGVAKQAAILDSLVGGDFIVEVPYGVSLLVALLVSVLAAIAILRSRSIALEVGALPVLAAVLFAGTGLSLALLHRHVFGATALFATGVAVVASTAVNHLFASRERERMRAMFSKFLSKDVVNQLAEQEELPRLTGERMEITAFFSDIRGFSTFSEKFKDDPVGLVTIMNTYLTRVSAVLQAHGACLDKYIGDAIVCIFGAPVRHRDHAVRACRAALAAQAEVGRIREEFKARGLPDVYTRIGLNTAVMFVGNVGSEQLFNYTAIGDGMNLASRLEGANKGYGSLIMIGPQTYAEAKDFIEARELDAVRVAGKSEPVTVYELLAEKGKLPDVKRQVCALYAEGLAAYRAAKFNEAAALAEKALAVDPEDGPAKALRERCQKLIAHPPPMPFEAVTNLSK